MFHKRIIIIILTLFACSQVLSAQSKGFSSFDTDKLLQEDVSNKFSRELLSKSDILPVGNIVNAEYYFVGPGDAISIQNLSASLMQDVVIVSPETSILLSRIGEVSLKGKTLAQAKQLICDTMKSRNSNSIISVSLYQPRRVLVNLRGDVSKPGAYSLPASYRVSTAIKVANFLQNQNISQSMQSAPTLVLKEKKRQQERVFSKAGLPELPAYSSRNISVVHDDGTAQNADVEKALALSNPYYDPYIREGDDIFVNFNKDSYPTISISGAVLRPVSIPFKKGDMVSFLLKLGGGFNSEADRENIYLFNPENNQKIRLTTDSMLTLIGSDIELIPGSSILVSEKSPDASNIYGTVAVTGEIKNPGTYSIKNDETKLKDVIEKAGGFKVDAYLPMAYIMRHIDQNLSSANPGGEYYDHFMRSDLTMEDTARFAIDINFRKPFVSCDFEALFEQNAEKFNVSLKNGDVIVIPQNPKSVFVYGQVNNPGFITFEKGKPMEWYIEKAGGYAVGAEKARARLIRAKNRVWLKPDDDSKVYAGDEIYVPKPKDMPAGAELQTYFLLATAVGTIIQMTYLILTLIKQN